MTRTHMKHCRAYVNGVDVSGYSRNVGALGWAYANQPEATWTDSVMNIVLGQADIQLGTINAVLDNDTAGLFNLASGSTQTMNAMVAIGAGTAPAAGDPVFTWTFEKTAYMVEAGTGFVSASVPFGGASYSSTLAYSKPWGRLLHAYAARTAVNSSTGIDDYGASTAKGGVFAYHLFSSNGTVTLKAQHASTNSDGSFADITLATSGSITAASTPASGFVALSNSLTINRYLRWQLSFGTATTATFVMALIRVV